MHHINTVEAGKEPFEEFPSSFLSRRTLGLGNAKKIRRVPKKKWVLTGSAGSLSYPF
jgi:hypothetical protein